MVSALELYRPTAPGPLPVLLRPLPPKPPRQRPDWSARVTRNVTARIPTEPPPVALDPPEPWHALKTAARKLNDGYNDTQDRALTVGGVLLAVVAVTWYPWIVPVAAAAGWLTALAYGAAALWLCRAGAPPWRWTTRRAGVALALTFAWGLAWLVRGAWVESAVTSFLMAQAFAQRTTGVDGGPRWASEAQLVAHWTDAGLFGARPPDGLWFRRLVPYQQDADGMETLTVVPMVGPRKRARVVNIGADSVEKARPALERVMGLKVGQLHVSHDDDHDAGAITLTVTPPVARVSVVKAVMPQAWDYDQPLFIGRDRLGRAHYRRTWGCHSGFVAMTQKGKTASVLYDVAHAALDPRITIYLLDFKGDERDFAPLRPLCKRSVTGASLASARKALTVLEEIEQVSESRASLGPDDHGIVVIVDEWFRLLSLAQRLSPDLAKQLDALLTELMATSASRRIKFVSLFQGGTADYINKPMRINIGQRFCGVTETSAEVRYFLETMPARLPKQAGQFVFKDDGVDPVLVTHPYIDPQEFARVCERAAALRRGESPAQQDPLTAAVHRLLALEPLKASVLLAMLPEDLRPDGADDAARAQRLGYLLKRMEGVEATTVRGHKHYGLTPAAALSIKPEATPDRGFTGPSPRSEAPSEDAEVSP